MRKSIGEQYAQWCINYTGMMDKVCKAGVNYRELVGGDDFGWGVRTPCIKEHETAITCQHCRFPTEAEVTAHVAESEEHLARQGEDIALIGAAHVDEQTSVVYVCQLCPRADRYVDLDREQFLDHLQSAHEITREIVKTATGRMLTHMDAIDWFQNDDGFTLPDGREVLLRSTRMRRRGENKAIWADGTKRRRR